MSAMGRLAIELHLVDAGEINLTRQFLDTLVTLGYEPDEYVTELDVVDEERVAALAQVRCYDCDYQDVALDMVMQSDGEYLCPGCDYDYVTEHRRHPLARIGRY